MTADEIHHKRQGWDEIIALKLKKPKNWNWELTTSKSSPHILFPVIRLYDYKGNLVLETQNNGPVNQRKTWHSDCLQPEKQWKIPRESKLRTSQSERRCSDKRDVLTPNKPGASINRRDRRRSDKNNNDFAKTSCENINVTAGNSTKQPGTDGSREQNKDAIRAEDSGVSRFKEGCLKKSWSDVVWKKQGQRHRRTKSDDVYRRKMKYNVPINDNRLIGEPASPNNENTSNHESNSSEKSPSNTGYERPSKTSSKYDSRYISENSDNTRIIQSTVHPRYKTRTSSAGTLIISEESFYKPNRRKRPERENTSADMTSAKISPDKANSKGSSVKSSENESNCDNLNGKTSSESRKSTLTSCTPTSYRISFPSTEDDDNSVRTVISRIRWRHEQSQLAKESGDEPAVEICEPEVFRRSSSDLFPSTQSTIEASQKPSQWQQYRKKKRRKVRNQRRQSDGSTSSNGDNAGRRSGVEEGTSKTKGLQ